MSFFPAFCFNYPRISKYTFILTEFLMFINNVFLFLQSNESVYSLSLIVILPLYLFLAKVVEQKASLTYVSGPFIKSHLFYSATLFPSHKVIKKFISCPWKGRLLFSLMLTGKQEIHSTGPCHWLTFVLPRKKFSYTSFCSINISVRI